MSLIDMIENAAGGVARCRAPAIRTNASGILRGLDRLVARANGGFVSGRSAVDGVTLYVSRGTALWPGFALRLGRPSELFRITLRTKR